MTDLIDRAITFSRAAHQAVGQRRKYTDEPYYTHPQAVANLVGDQGGSEAMVAAALLHDVLEDTQVKMIDIGQEFTPQIMTWVYELTDQFTEPHYGNRKYRKELERARLGTVSPEAQTIKCADLIHNAESIVEHDPDFARVFLPEMRALLEVLRKGDTSLWTLAQGVLVHAESSIGPHIKAKKLYKTADLAV